MAEASGQAVDVNIQGETNIYDDEINLIDYFLIVWKRKRFILILSFLPALLVGLFYFFSPGDYKVTYLYDSTVISLH